MAVRVALEDMVNPHPVRTEDLQVDTAGLKVDMEDLRVVMADLRVVMVEPQAVTVEHQAALKVAATAVVHPKVDMADRLRVRSQDTRHNKEATHPDHRGTRVPPARCRSHTWLHTIRVGILTRFRTSIIASMIRRGDFR